MKNKIHTEVPDIRVHDEKGHHEDDDFADDSTRFDLLLTWRKFRDGWWRSKKFLIGCCLTVAAVSSGIAYFLAGSPPPEVNKVPVQEVMPVQQPVQPKLASLRDFMINFKDGSGKDKIFICALALEISPDHKYSFKDDHFDVRKIIYKKLIKCSQENSSLILDRNRLRDVLYVELNEQLGGSIVSRIYFTKFLIL